MNTYKINVSPCSLNSLGDLTYTQHSLESIHLVLLEVHTTTSWYFLISLIFLNPELNGVQTMYTP